MRNKLSRGNKTKSTLLFRCLFFFYYYFRVINPGEKPFGKEERGEGKLGRGFYDPQPNPKPHSPLRLSLYDVGLGTTGPLLQYEIKFRPGFANTFI